MFLQKLLQSVLPRKLQWKHYILLFVFLVAAFLRLYNIPKTVMFLGDQGRDALVVSSIFKDFDPVFIGPVTSVGNMYLGPLYYYFMLPFLLLTYPSPMGPVYAVAVLGILTVYLLYSIGKKFLGEKVALWTASLFGLSAVVAYNTRFSWNPNPAPLVSLFMLFFTYKALKKDERYWIAVTLCFAILIQLHYLTLLAGAGFGLLWIYQLVQKIKAKKSVRKLLTATLLSVLVFSVSLVPLILFDSKHDGLNRKAFIEILTRRDTFSKENVQGDNSFIQSGLNFKSRAELIVTDIAIGKHEGLVNFGITLFILSCFIYLTFKKNKQKKDITAELVLASFLFTGIIGTALYKHSVYDHYISYLFPVIFFIIGYVLDFLSTRKVLGYLAIGFFLVLFVKFNYNRAQVILKPLGWTIAHIQAVAKTIEDRVSQGEKYNIVLLNSTGDITGQNYRYFLSTSDKPPVREAQFGEVDTLFIIDEERKIKNEMDSPVYEIVTFPNKIPQETYYIPNGPEIIVLRKTAQ